tara:strand:- start:301 stop:720 length:420 start_codon:yes stop_codon:yes gene_type:complete
LTSRISDKDKKDWNNFLTNKEKIEDKDSKNIGNIRQKTYRVIDLHGFSLEDANDAIDKFIIKCFHEGIHKIKVITGKGLRSSSEENPYISKDLSILKHSVPEFIKSKKELMKCIIKMETANYNDGGSGAFNIFLKKIKE